jgi:prophage maintenance system killer protein
MNGYELVADEESTYTMITLVAQGKMSKKGLAKWVKGNCSKEKLTKLRDVI